MHHTTSRGRRVLCAGLPLWQYNTDLVFLEALNSVARSLEYLAEHGIVHRDLSCHNVLVGLGGEKGLVLDLDFASRFPAHEMRTGDTSEPTYSAVDNAPCDLVPERLMPCDANGHVLGLDSQLDREHQHNPGAASDLNLESIPREVMLPVLTTLQFAAYDVLKAAQNNEHIIPTASHDLESLYWVIGHTVLARLLSRVTAAQENPSPIKEEETTTVFTTLMGVASAQFWPTDSTGRLDLQQLRVSRRTGGPLQWLFHDPALLTFFADYGNAGAPLLGLILSMSKDFNIPSQIAAAKDRAFQALCARQHGDYTSSTLQTLEVPPPRLSLETLKGYIEIAVESEKARSLLRAFRCEGLQHRSQLGDWSRIIEHMFTSFLCLPARRSLSSAFTSSSYLLVMCRTICIVARPLSTFSSDHELLQGLASIVKVLSRLHAQGLVHRHITYNNVLLCDSQPEPAGILIDFDLMRPSGCDNINRSTITSHGHAEQQVELSRVSWSKRKQRVSHADEYFAAYEVIRSLLLRQQSVYAPEHDAESTYWAIGYSILQRVLDSIPESERKLRAYTSDAHGIEHSTSTLYGELRAISEAHFGSVDLGSIMRSRHDGGPLLWWTKVPKMAALVARAFHDPTLGLLEAMAQEFVQPLPTAIARVLAEGKKISRNAAPQDETVPPHTTFELAKLKGYIDTALAAERKRLGLST